MKIRRVGVVWAKGLGGIGVYSFALRFGDYWLRLKGWSGLGYKGLGNDLVRSSVWGPYRV